MKLIKFNDQDGPDQIIYADNIIGYELGNFKGQTIIHYLDFSDENCFELQIDMDELVDLIHRKSDTEESEGYEVIDLRHRPITDKEMGKLLSEI